MSQRHYLRCMGQPALLAPNGDPIRFRTRKHMALLVYLAVEPRVWHQRDRLADMLWPGRSRHEARHSLATSLSVLRGTFGSAALESGRERIRFVTTAIALDLDRLASGDVLGSEVETPLEVAAFLDGFDIPDAGEFMHWKDRQQARRLPSIRDALVRLMDRCRRTGDFRTIELFADRMLGLDDLNEDAIRAKMEARAFAGDRLSALKVFGAWKDQLGRELGASPSALVDGMAIRLRSRGWERASAEPIPVVPTDQWRNRPFVGRATQYRTLYEAWEQTRAGETGHVLVLGDSGIGKSTLAERLTTAAGLEGAVTSRVQCYDLEREIPYAALGSLVRGLLDRPGVSATPPEALAELARTVPEVRRRFPAIPAPVHSQGESARIRLTDAAEQMVLCIAEEHPVILVVDDVHMADDASLAVLHLIMRRARGQPIMVVMIARPGELSQAPQASRLRENAAGLGLRTLEVGSMSEEESAELLASFIPSDENQPSGTARRALLHASGGYPMVLELLVRDWQANGEESLALSLDAMTSDPGRGTGPAEAYQLILHRITSSLDPVARNVFSLAAILGNRLNDVAMYGLMDLNIGDIMTGMAQLTALRVIREGGDGLEFVNELIRAQAYLAVPSTVRRTLHTRVADLLMQQEQSGDMTLGLEIAWHCMRGGRPDEAKPYVLRGARVAMRRGAAYEAERALSTVLPSLVEPARNEALLLLAEVLHEQGKWRELLEVASNSLTHSDPDQLGALHVLKTDAERRLALFSPLQLHEIVMRITEAIEDSEDRAPNIRAADLAASIVGNSLDRAATVRLLRAVNGMDVKGLATDELTHYWLVKALLLYHTGNVRDSIGFVDRAIDRLRDAGAANSTFARLQQGLGVIYSFKGDYAQAVNHLRDSYKTALRIGNAMIAARSAGNLVLCLAYLGDYASALEWYRTALARSAEATPGPHNFALPGPQGAALAYAMMGRSKEAIQTVVEEAAQLARFGYPWEVHGWQLVTADTYWICGHAAEGRAFGRTATWGNRLTPPVDASAGAFARWTALSADNGERSIAGEVVGKLTRQLDFYDAINQVEILCAASRLNDPGGVATGRDSRLEEALSKVPKAAAEQLRRLGVLLS